MHSGIKWKGKRPLTADVITDLSLTNKENVYPDSEDHEKDENSIYSISHECYLSIDFDDELASKCSRDPLDTLMHSCGTVAKIYLV